MALRLGERQPRSLIRWQAAFAWKMKKRQCNYQIHSQEHDAFHPMALTVLRHQSKDAHGHDDSD
jgi:hypothetical protein